jgi:hypothetical protein
MEWIKMSDEKPAQGERVLIVPVENHAWVVISKVCKDEDGEVFCDDDGFTFPINTVSHWMPIPKFNQCECGCEPVITETVEEPDVDMARSYMYVFLIGVCVIEALFVSVYWSNVNITTLRFLMVQFAIMYAVILIDNHQIKTENENI